MKPIQHSQQKQKAKELRSITRRKRQKMKFKQDEIPNEKHHRILVPVMNQKKKTICLKIVSLTLIATKMWLVAKWTICLSIRKTNWVENLLTGKQEEHAEWPWHFFHDALSLMTSSETKDWMESKGWLKHWTLPHHDLNKHIPHCSNPRPIGNNMRAQPMDHTMNEDHDDCVLRQVAATCLLPNDDPRKFSLATPNLCASACTRVHDANGISSF